MLRKDDLSSFGERLKSTREKMGISVQDAASRLHLSPRFINMLENDNLLESTLPLIYLRGYLRSYTRLLNIPETDLAWALEKLDPKPAVALDPVPVASESLSSSFPLESNPYVSRIATVLISLALLTSLTAWWYHHANNDAPAVLALDQPLTSSEPAAQPIEAAASPAPLNISNDPLLQAATKGPEIEQSKVPEAAIDLAAKKPVTLASAATEQNSQAPTAKPASKHHENDDDGVDEQE